MSGETDGNRPPEIEREHTDVLAAEPRLLAGKYRLGRLIGEGGMGAVYEAEHVGLGALVAVKLLNPFFATSQTALTRFRREARAAAAVRHPSIVKVTDIDVDEEGVPFLVMELLEGESLSAVLRRQRVLEPKLAAAILAQLLEGLAVAHEQRLIHRDLKPGNIFLAVERPGVCRVKILDFGVSKFADDAQDVTATGAVIGTPRFMAPEQARGESEIDSRADIYSLGLVLYLMTTGRAPIGGSTRGEVLEQVVEGTIVPPRQHKPDLPEALEAVIMRATSARREERFPDAWTMLDALRKAVPDAPSEILLAVSAAGPQASVPPMPAGASVAISLVTNSGLLARPGAPSNPASLAHHVAGAARKAGRSGGSGGAGSPEDSSGTSPPTQSAPHAMSAEAPPATEVLGPPSRPPARPAAVSPPAAASDAGAASAQNGDGAAASPRIAARTGDAGPPAPTEAARAMAADSVAGTTTAAPTEASSSGRLGRRRMLFAGGLVAVVALAVAAWPVSRLVRGPDRAGAGAQTATGPAAAVPPVAGPPLHFGITRYLPREDVDAAHRPFVEYLASMTGRKVELSIYEDYQDLGEMLISGELDLAALSAYSYVRAQRKSPGIQLLATPVTGGGPSYEGLIVARADTGIRSLADLKGKVFCYVSPNSSSGYLYPRAVLRRAGLEPDRAFSATRFTGDHLSALRALSSGACDGAAVFASVVYDAKAHGMRPDTFRILGSTDRIPYDAYCASAQVPAELATRIEQALLALSPGGDKAAELFARHSQILGFTKVHDADFNSVRAIESHADAPAGSR